VPSLVRRKFSLFALYPSHSRRTFVLGPEDVHDGFVTLETIFDCSDFYPCSGGASNVELSDAAGWGQASRKRLLLEIAPGNLCRKGRRNVTQGTNRLGAIDHLM
jgi:hypothetical protein